MNRSLNALLSATVCATFTTSCVKKSSQNLPKALVTPAQFAQAQQIINAIDYIPFNETRTGCYARSLYMAMELAAEKIPSSAALVVAFKKENRLNFKDHIWAWHTAPMLVQVEKPEDGISFKDTKDEDIFIFDPAVNKGAPLTLTDWTQKIDGTRAKIFMLPGSREVWNAYNRSKDRKDFIASFKDLPDFLEKDVSDACRWMKVTWQEAKVDAAMISKLEERTRYLVGRLKLLDKYDKETFDCDVNKLIRSDRDDEEPVKRSVCQSYLGEDIEAFAKNAVCYEGNKTAAEQAACVEKCLAEYAAVHKK